MKQTVRILLICLAALLFTGCTATSDPDLSPTPAPENISEASLPEADSAEPTPAPEPLTFTVNRYAMGEDCAAYLGDVGDYERLIDAVCAGEEAVTCADAESAQRAAEIFAESPYAAFAVPAVYGAEITLEYSDSGDADTVDGATDALIESVVTSDSNVLETALALYRAVASMTYEESEANSLYRMLTERKGGTREFAAALHYLFAQNGIPARLASGTAGEAEHFWVIAMLDGMYYHFDPTFENGSTGGAGLTYFGMSDEMRAYTGCETPYTTGSGGYVEMADELCSDTRFEALFLEVTSWNNDPISHFLYLAYSFEADYLTSISTETFEAAAG